MERIKCAILSIAGLLVGLGREHCWCFEKFDILYVIQRLPKEKRRERERGVQIGKRVSDDMWTQRVSFIFLIYKTTETVESLSLLSHDSREQHFVCTQ